MTSSQRNLLSLSRLMSQCDMPRGVLGKLTASYGSSRALAVLQKDPYGTMRQAGASLENADRLAGLLRISLEKRALGHAEWALASRSMNQAMLTAKLQFALELPNKTTRVLIEKLVTKGALRMVGAQVVSEAHYEKNMDVVREVRRRKDAPANPRLTEAFRGIASGQALSRCQRAAVMAASKATLSIITGGPGSGKSHTVREMVAACPDSRVTAPTGRAARNASGKTVHYFKTIQETGQNEFKNASLIVVDEASMLSTELFWTVLHLAPDDAHIVLVGDVDQLPPIDEGDVFRDLLQSGLVPVTVLDTNLRSSSGIQAFARSILGGTVSLESSDVEIVECDSLDDVINALPTFSRRLKAVKSTGTPLTEHIFLTPHNATRISLNRAIQMLFWGSLESVDVVLAKDFPGAPRGTPGVACVCGSSVRVTADSLDFSVSLAAADKLARVSCVGGLEAEAECAILPGDKVIVTKNTPDACNGDVGVYQGEREIKFDAGKAVIPAITEKDPGMTLAYAVTVHKAQGSEFDCVVVPVTNVAAWDRSLLYTAVTRAKSKVFLLGSREDVESIVGFVRAPRTSLLRALL